LSPTLAPESLKTIAWQQHQALTGDGGFEDHQAFLGLFLESMKLSDQLTFGKSRRALVVVGRWSWLLVWPLSGFVIVISRDGDTLSSTTRYINRPFLLAGLRPPPGGLYPAL
jgi:hypothetical protein